jgi:hypothetical protein
MLQLNNYPLAGGAIHVAYSTSATARVRQQALQQAKQRASTMAAYAAGVDSPQRALPPPPPGLAPGAHLSSPMLGAAGAGGGFGRVPGAGLWPLTPAGMGGNVPGFSPSPMHSAIGVGPGSGATTPCRTSVDSAHDAIGLPPSGSGGWLRRGPLDFGPSPQIPGGAAAARRSFEVGASPTAEHVQQQRHSIDVLSPGHASGGLHRSGYGMLPPLGSNGGMVGLVLWAAAASARRCRRCSLLRWAATPHARCMCQGCRRRCRRTSCTRCSALWGRWTARASLPTG